MAEAATIDQGKRVSWVELYFDLIFVFAVSQAARDIGARPTWAGVAIAFGACLTLWWSRCGPSRRRSCRGGVLGYCAGSPTIRSPSSTSRDRYARETCDKAAVTV